MFNQGTLKKTYALDQHVGRANVLEFYKDGCRNKPQPTVKKFFDSSPNSWTFDYKAEGLMRALIRDFTSPGHNVVVSCMRYGMRAVAAKLECRKFTGVELEETAYKRAVSRYSEQLSVEVPTRVIAVRWPISSPTTKIPSRATLVPSPRLANCPRRSSPPRRSPPRSPRRSSGVSGAAPRQTSLHRSAAQRRMRARFWRLALPSDSSSSTSTRCSPSTGASTSRPSPTRSPSCRWWRSRKRTSRASWETSLKSRWSCLAKLRCRAVSESYGGS